MVQSRTEARARAERATATEQFAGEAAYVPYFWWARTTRASRRVGDIWIFEVTAEDAAIFPELARVDGVAIRRTDGCVHETSPEDAVRDWLKGR